MCCIGLVSFSNISSCYEGVLKIEDACIITEVVVVVVVVVCSGFTSLSTIFQSYHDGVWLRQGAYCSLL